LFLDRFNLQSPSLVNGDIIPKDDRAISEVYFQGGVADMGWDGRARVGWNIDATMNGGFDYAIYLMLGAFPFDIRLFPRVAVGV
jgi:hypothetical protein